ncbi:MAG TPA: hypothetical protein VFJ17_09360 [Mycobacteriales bacterium]|jgi:hypothetical protein|nr:hypothetical protein [Mycobacteriales bacterium]
MPLLRRETAVVHTAGPVEQDSPDADALRHETDPDPVIEEAAERLRAALTCLDARDEWGRAIPWRQVARIALGPLASRLRDAETAALLSAATDTAVPAAAPMTLEPELFTTQRSGAETGWPSGSA